MTAPKRAGTETWIFMRGTVGTFHARESIWQPRTPRNPMSNPAGESKAVRGQVFSRTRGQTLETV